MLKNKKIAFITHVNKFLLLYSFLVFHLIFPIFISYPMIKEHINKNLKKMKSLFLAMTNFSWNPYIVERIEEKKGFVYYEE